MCHGMLRHVRFPQEDGAGRELMRRRLARRDEKRDMRPCLCDVECQREAGHMTWHMDVGEEEMDCGGTQLQVTESFFRMASFDHLESRIAHRTPDQKADERFVFHNHDFFRFCH